MLPHDTFSEVVRNTPLVAIDLVVYNPQGEALVGMRANKPAQNFWFVPGGRIYKNETIQDAFLRITQVELALVFDYSAARFIGVFQHIYPDNFSGVDDFGTHYIVLAHEIVTTEPIPLTPGDPQHTQYRWMPVPELIHAADVHPFTKNYFRLEGHPVQNQGIVPFLKPEHPVSFG
jgi:colanic acid biosynthesis protein WcaH